MKTFFKKYLFVFEFIAVAILLAVGIYAKLNEEIFLYIVGLALIIFGLFRVVPLVKTTKDKIMKFIYIGEIILNIVAGVILIAAAGKEEDSGNLMGYIVGGVLYLRGLLYFYSTVIRKESTDHTKFFTHIGIITLGVVILFREDLFNEAIMAWIVLILCVLAATFISISGIGHYKNFRYEQLAKDETRKAMEKNKEKELEEKIPLEDPKPTKDPVIDPLVEERDEARL